MASSSSRTKGNVTTLLHPKRSSGTADWALASTSPAKKSIGMHIMSPDLILISGSTNAGRASEARAKSGGAESACCIVPVASQSLAPSSRLPPLPRMGSCATSCLLWIEGAACNTRPSWNSALVEGCQGHAQWYTPQEDDWPWAWAVAYWPCRQWWLWPNSPQSKPSVPSLGQTRRNLIACCKC